MLRLKVPIFLSIFLFIFLGASKASAMVDFSVQTITVSPVEPAFNETCVITVTASNIGDVVHSGAVGIDNVNKNFTDFVIRKSSISKSGDYQPNTSFTFTYEGFFNTKGSKNVGFGIDEGNLLEEAKEDNNYKNTKVNVVDRYDLYVESISISPISPVVSQPVTITVSVKNSGAANLNDSTGLNILEYKFSNFKIDNEILPVVNSSNQVAPGSYLEYKYLGKFLTAGEQTLDFKIDVNNQLLERNENNNFLSVKKTVSDIGSADVEFTSFSIDIERPVVDQIVTITATLKNAGKYSLIDDFGWLGEDNNSVFPTIIKDIAKDLAGMVDVKAVYPVYPSSLKPLNTGESLSYKFSGVFKEAGTKLVDFNFNSNKRLPESKWDNNEKKLEFVVYKDTEARDEFAIKNFHIELISTSSAKLVWETTENAEATLFYKLNEYTSFDEVKSVKAKGHSLTLDNLRPSTIYNFKVKANIGKVVKNSEVINFKMPGSVALELLSAVNISAGTEKSETLVEFSTNFVSKGSVYWRKKDKTYGAYPVTEGVLHRLIVKTLEVGEYEYYLDLTTLSGVGLTSPVFVFKFLDESSNSTNSKSATSTMEKVSTDKAKNDIKTVNNQNKKSEQEKLITNSRLYETLKGKIVLTVEAKGEAYYIHPQNMKRYFLGRPQDAFLVMRELGGGMSNANLKKIPVGLSKMSGIDSDKDGLSDMFEDAIGTNKNKADSDGDGYKDADELKNSFNPVGSGKLVNDLDFSKKQNGRIILQVEGKGEAWYVSASDGKRYFLGRPEDAFGVMREKGVGISSRNFESL